MAIAIAIATAQPSEFTGWIVLAGLSSGAFSKHFLPRRASMATPNVTVAIEPSDGSSIFFEPVARKDTNSTSSGLVCLLLTITNHESQSVHLNKVTLEFP